MQEPDDYKYAAFISYTSAPEDRKWAEWLRDALASYELPPPVADRGPSVGRVFLDNREMAASPDLQKALQDALFHARWLIVICSPRTRDSEWVSHEIGCFKFWERQSRMLALLVEGEPRLSFPPGLIQQRHTGSGPDVIIERVEPRAASVLPRQEKTEAELKQDALLALLAALTEVEFAKLLQAHQDRQRRTTQTTYFHDMVRSFGLPRGVGPLTEEQVARRHYSFRFEHDQGRLVSVKRVGGRGNLREDNEGLAQWDVGYRGDGSLEALDARNRHGHTRVREVFSRDGRTVDFLHADDSARAQAGFAGDIGLSESDRDRMAAGRADILRHLLDHDANGFVVRRTYYRNTYNQPARDALGNSGELLEVDGAGRPTRSCFVDASGAPAIQRNGVAATLFRYDDQGRQLEKSYQDGAGQLIRGDEGYARVRYQYDRDGNCTSRCYFDEQDRPCLSLEGIHELRVEYGEYGDIVADTHLGIDHQPIFDRHGCCRRRWTTEDGGRAILVEWLSPAGDATYGPDGAAGVCMVHDEAENLVAQTYLDLAGSPTRCRDGYATLRNVWDERGNILEQRFLDEAGHPTLDRDGAARTTFAYDPRGNRVEDARFGSDGQPAPDGRGIARTTNSFDERNNLVEIRYWGPSGEPATDADGGSILRASYDAEGRRVEIQFLDADGNPLPGGREARRTMRYDGRGNLLEFASFDADGAPTADRSGAARTTYTLNSRGDILEVASVDAAGAPAPVHWGCPREKWTYDQRGNRTSVAWFGADDQPTRNHHGYARIECVYDELGQPVAERFYDGHGRPAPNRDGAAREEFRRDRRGMLTDKLFFDVDGNPGLASGVARVSWTRDERGNTLREQCLDRDGRLVNGTRGYAVLEFAHDNYNRMISVAAYGEHGEPILEPNTGCWRHSNRHDVRGNLIEVRFFGLDGRPCIGARGYCVQRAHYDALDQVTAVEYLDTEDRPILDSEGAHRIVRTYDDRGNSVSLAVFGVRGEPVERRGAYHRAERRYDAFSRVVTTEYFDLAGRAVSPPEADLWALPEPKYS